jgi:hypothetical protein
MNELVVIVEGETEQTFVRDQLSAHLAIHGITAWAILPGRNRNRGGIKKWRVAREDILRSLKEGRYCTTMMDFYAMPDDWPGRCDAKVIPWMKRASRIEGMIKNDIVSVMGGGFNSKFFIPYVQLHEFEALAFADVKKLSSVLAPLSSHTASYLEQKFSEVLNDAGSPEAINDGYLTCPSRRIAKIVGSYRKRIHGPIVTGRIGLDVLRERCSHFSSWLTRLERLGT